MNVVLRRVIPVNVSNATKCADSSLTSATRLPMLTVSNAQLGFVYIGDVEVVELF